jgi:hypothetical protein
LSIPFLGRRGDVGSESNLRKKRTGVSNFLNSNISTLSTEPTSPLLWIGSEIVVFSVASQAAGSPVFPVIFIAYFTFVVGKNNCLVKIDQMGSRGNTMGIMANSAWGPLFNNVHPVLRKTVIGQNRVTVVAFIAECIGLWILRSQISYREIPL